ncbi:uncharacterized protein [Nicotiana sylvestris]|uniref:uncharacterized protein n=1 Tax=Nicotiana sylvestris TaxID=4096 RepID=UPI00388C33F6
MPALWPFIAWGIDVIGLIEPATSNGHRYILVAIYYFTRWVEAMTFKSVTKKAVVDFVHLNLICRFEIPKVIITDNGDNLNSHLMKEGYCTTVRTLELSLIDEKRLAAVCQGQLYQKRMERTYNRKVHPRKFEVGQQVLKHILPHQAEAKEGKCVEMAVNSDAVKRNYV